MDLPPCQLLQALSWNVPIRYELAGPVRTTAHRLSQLRARIIGAGEDRCVRADLLQTCFYIFHQGNSASRVLPALVADAASTG